ncbi:histidine phosphatase superfamily [Dioszegia hungarica]|uniref:Histidine phosphatase superfamily n=1 Tax=Dioszegia hungarica TaxID=4972 RepID=A0AA38LWD8_9TREE|nr:histidine phosphatase superfamily [Dioszegia hungarica]KAI9638280.1 histidine phosphatase superfamily [Dioszegia hungarica]
MPNRAIHAKFFADLSAISPFYIPTALPDPLPPTCSLTRVSLLIRHSSILGNDDEYDDSMGPFIEKIKRIRDEHPEKIPQGEWAFLGEWESPIKEDKVEVLSERGKADSLYLGQYIRQQYNSLFPPPDKKKSSSESKHKHKGKKGKKAPPYKVWTASSSRDIETAQAYIKGSFPKHQSGPNGDGDGEVVQLIKVPNKAKDWDKSLTPHKACDAFEKLSSLEPANKWLALYAGRVRERLSSLMPFLIDELDDQDVLGMQMLCGYESIAQGSSSFCHLFTDDEWLDVEYYFDVRFHYMMGYGNSLSPYLGGPWVKTALHLLDGKDTGGDDHPKSIADGSKKLPKPKLPPNATHTQLLHPSFTHRESPAFVAVFLNLYNATSLKYPASAPPSLDHRVDERAWRTSHLTPFLGHIALERFSCHPTRDSPDVSSEQVGSGDNHHHHGHKGKQDGSYVRAVVNGKQERMGGCEDGVNGSCKWETFVKFVNGRAERWGDFEGVCEKKKED